MCGFCEPGFIMAIAARMQAGGGGEIDHVCACGAYARIGKAIARALQVAAPAERRNKTQFSLGSSDGAHESP